MKKLIVLFFACVLLSATLFVTGCDNSTPHPDDGNDDDTGDTDNTGDTGNTEPSPVSDFEFELNDDGNSYSVINYVGSYKNVIIPSSYLDKPVTAIGEGAFFGCGNLKSITIPNSVTSIGDYAFYYCSSLTSVTIGNSVTSIGEYAFHYCISLESITVAEGNSKYHSSGNCLIETESKTLILGCKNSIIPSDGSVTCIGHYAFYWCSSLTSITIPDSVTSIGDRAFDNCYKLVEVYNLSSLDITAGSWDNGYVGYYALDIYTDINTPSKLWTNSDGYIFYENGDTCLIGYTGDDTELILPDSCNGKNYAIYNCAFFCCYNLTSITIPNSVTSIGRYAFSDCSKLTSVHISDIAAWCAINFGSCQSNPLYYAENLYLNGSLVTKVVIPDGITTINYTFYNCTSLTSITIPNSVTSIGGGAFSGCSSLTEIKFNAVAMNDLSYDNLFSNAGNNGEGIKVTVGKDVTKIPAYLFDDVSKITSVEFEEGSVCESIGKNAFYYCSSLTSITIPNSVTSIESYAFYGCYRLVEVYNLSSLKIIIGSSSNGYVGYYALDVYTDINNPSKLWTNSDGYTFYENGDTCYLMGYTGDDTELTLPDSCKGKNYAIYKYAFEYCSSLTSITIPDSVTNIGKWAFYACNKLTSVTFEDTSTWYVTENSDMTGGTEIDVTDASKNAGYLKSDHYDEYWYKK